MQRAWVVAAAIVAGCSAPPPRLPHDRAGAELVNDYPAPAAPPTSLRVVSYNVERAQHVSRVARAILDDDRLRSADVFLLQEVESHPDEDDTRSHRLARALRLNYAYVPARAEGAYGGSHGLAILSRFPIRDVRAIALPRYDTHINPRRRIAVAARIDVGAHPIHLYDVHLDTRISARERVAQLQPVFADAARHDGIAVIGGDLNTNPFRWAWRVIPMGRSPQAAALDRAAIRAGFTAPTRRSGPTQHAGPLHMRLDSLYVRGAAVTRTGVLRHVHASDHWPLWIELAIP